MLGGQSFEELSPGFEVTLQNIIIIMYHNIPEVYPPLSAIFSQLSPSATRLFLNEIIPLHLLQINSD